MLPVSQQRWEARADRKTHKNEKQRVIARATEGKSGAGGGEGRGEGRVTGEAAAALGTQKR